MPARSIKERTAQALPILFESFSLYEYATTHGWPNGRQLGQAACAKVFQIHRQLKAQFRHLLCPNDDLTSLIRKHATPFFDELSEVGAYWNERASDEDGVDGFLGASEWSAEDYVRPI